MKFLNCLSIHWLLIIMLFKVKPITVSSESDLQILFETSNKGELFSHGNMQRLFDQQRQCLMTNLRINETDSVLDLACGFGEQLLGLSKFIGSGVGIDWAKSMIDCAKSLKVKTAYININYFHMPIDSVKLLGKKFSKVYIIGAFEHLLNQLSTVQLSYDILYENGSFMIMTQNKSVLWHRIANNFKNGLKHHSTDNFLNLDELSQLFEKVGFKHIQFGYWDFVPQGDIAFPFNKLFCFLQYVLGGIFPSLFKGGIFIVGTK